MGTIHDIFCEEASKLKFTQNKEKIIKAYKRWYMMRVGFTNQWRIFMLRKIFFALMLVPIFSFARTPLGEKLVQGLWTDINESNFHKIKEYMSKEFQAINGNGSYNRFQELQLLKIIHHEHRIIGDIRATQGKNLIVVSYTARYTPEITEYDLKPIETVFYCLSAWKKCGEEWKWVAHSEYSDHK